MATWLLFYQVRPLLRRGLGLCLTMNKNYITSLTVYEFKVFVSSIHNDNAFNIIIVIL
jgi:hypothetical protein